MDKFLKMRRKIAKKDKKYAKNIERYLKKIKKKAKRIFGENVRTFIFGSFVEGRWIPGSSDIDILILCDRMPKSSSERAKIRMEIINSVGFDSPFEIHFSDSELFKWYMKTTKGNIKEF